MPTEFDKFPQKQFLAAFIFFIVFFIFAFVMSKFETRNYVEIDFQYSLTNALVDGSKNRLNRGGIIIHKKYVLDGDASLIFNPCNDSIWLSHGPIIDFNDEPHEYTLSDLAYPFTISKKKNTDTLVVNKNGCVMYFRIK